MDRQTKTTSWDLLKAAGRSRPECWFSAGPTLASSEWMNAVHQGFMVIFNTQAQKQKADPGLIHRTDRFSVAMTTLLSLMAAAYAYACTHRQVMKNQHEELRLTDALFIPCRNMVMLHRWRREEGKLPGCLSTGLTDYSQRLARVHHNPLVSEGGPIVLPYMQEPR